MAKEKGWPAINMKPETIVNNAQGEKNLGERKKVKNLAAWPNAAGAELNISMGSVVKSRPV